MALSFWEATAKARDRSHGVAFKRQVAQEVVAGAALHALCYWNNYQTRQIQLLKQTDAEAVARRVHADVSHAIAWLRATRRGGSATALASATQANPASLPHSDSPLRVAPAPHP